MARFKSSRDYRNFEKAVRQDFRYIRSDENKKFLKTVLETSKLRKVTLKERSICWRAQIGHGWRKEVYNDGEIKVECCHPPSRMKPLRNEASEGRANPRGIRCLYLATTKKIAISEVRPWIGSYISVAQFRLCRRLEIINCSYNQSYSKIWLEEPPPEEVEEVVWSDIGQAFSAPTIRRDNVADYAATQILAELFKKAGYDSIVYRSNFGEDGYNIALFDIEAAKLINCCLFQVKGVDVKFYQAGNPSCWGV